MLNRLSAVQVARANKPGRYSDGGGLYLRVAEYRTKAGLARSKNWIFRFERGGRERLMGLGSLDTLALKDAREKALECRRALLDGLDPIEVRREGRQKTAVQAARGMTFRACAEAYMRAHRKGWKSRVHAKQWSSTLDTYVYPTIGALPVAAVDTALVVKILEPIWWEKHDTAVRVRGRIEAVLDWAKAHNYREGENPARWRGHLDKLLTGTKKVKREKRHHPALPYADAPEFMGELRGQEDISAKALEFTILTAARTCEVIAANWSSGEIDLDAKLWNVPAGRMKGDRAHVVPLCDRAVAIVRSLPRVDGTDFVFPGARTGKGLSNMAMLEKLRGMRPGLTVHGFRSTFRDWAGDCTNHARDVIEMALSHAIDDETEAAYRRSTAVQKRRRLMADWSRYCMAAPITGKVLPLARARAK